MLIKSNQVYWMACYKTIIWIIYLKFNDSFIIAMVQVSLGLRYSIIYWILIMYFDFIPCCLSKVAHRMMIWYNLKYSKVIKQPIENSLLMIEEMYIYGLLSESLLENL